MPSEYFKLLDSKDPTRRSLRVNRVVLVDIGLSYTLDYFPDVNGKPLLLIVKKGTPFQDIKNAKWPPIDNLIPIYREVTNERPFFAENMALNSYVMGEFEKIGTEFPSTLSLSKRYGKKLPVVVVKPSEDEKNNEKPLTEA